MKTTIYISRHSEPMKIENSLSSDSIQLKNEKQILSCEGERRAKILSELEELQDVDVVISSNYVRAMSTAKYIAYKNNKDLIIMDDFGERKFGIDSWNELPEKFENKQYMDENYKIPNGESRTEVASRMFKTLNKVLEEYKGKKIAIISHATAMNYLFMKLGVANISEDNIPKFHFKNKEFFDGNYFAPELFKLKFEENELINIENIKVSYE